MGLMLLCLYVCNGLKPPRSNDIDVMGVLLFLGMRLVLIGLVFVSFS